MSKFRLSKQAGQDLADIADYTAIKWGEEKAESYINALFQAFDKIALAPDLGRRRTDIPEPYLCFSVGSHLIIYRLNQAKQRIEILNILHPKMDLAKRLKNHLKRIPNSGLN